MNIPLDEDGNLPPKFRLFPGGVIFSIMAIWLSACSGTSDRRCGDARFGHINDPLSGWGASDVVSFPQIALDHPSSHSFSATGLPRPLLPNQLLIQLFGKPSQGNKETLAGLGENLEIEICFLDSKKSVFFQKRVHACDFLRSTYCKSEDAYFVELISPAARMPDITSYEVEVRIIKPLRNLQGHVSLSGSSFWKVDRDRRNF